MDRILVMNQGELLYDDVTKEIFSHYKELEAVGLRAPEITYIMNELAQKGFAVDTKAVTLNEAVSSVLAEIKRRK